MAEEVAAHDDQNPCSLAVLMEAQAALQRDSFRCNFYTMSDEERVDFIRWNVLALEDELHEMLGEVGWKPWATSRHVNSTQALKELVDALHFFMNLVLAVGSFGEDRAPVEPHQLGEQLGFMYFEKRAVNAQRQVDGYDGVAGKCPACRRDVTDPANLKVEAGGAWCLCGEQVVVSAE